MNANMNFDQMYKRSKLQDARESLKCWEESLKLTTLTTQEREFLEKAAANSRQNVAKWERYVEEWWT